MINLVDLLEKHEREIFFLSPHAHRHQRETYGQFLNRCRALRIEIKNSKLAEAAQNGIVGFQPDNNLDSIAFFFALISMDLKPALFSRRLRLEQARAMAGPSLFLDKRQVTELNLQAEAHVNPFDHHEFKLPLDRTLIFWTSGTSSKPKAAVLKLANFYYNALGSRENIPFDQGDHWLLKLPIEHVGGMSVLFRALLSGGTVVLDPTDEPWIPQVTHLSFVATQLHRYLHSRPTRMQSPASLKAVLLGGGAIPKDLVDRGVDQGLPLFKSYGMTEMASQITTTRADASKPDLHTSGWTLPGRELKIESGHIYVRGPCLFEGYLDETGRLAGIQADGWLRTKDLGEWTPHGLKILGRSDRMFISAGENIQPEVIEQTLLEYPGILGAKVVPLDDIEYGQRPLAYIRVDEVQARELDVREIQKFLKKKLSGLQIPKEILGWNEMPDKFKSAKDL